MKKIIAFTTIRSDYDLMSHLYNLLQKDKEIDLKLIVAGAHMSYSYGHSVDLIEKDGYSILLKIESLIDSNSKQARIKSASILLQNSIDIIAQFNPDLIIYAGDREDTIIAGLIAGYLQIPSVHFFGGDHVKDGHIDNPVRHAVSKLSTTHFVSIEQHKQRLVKMGEDPKRIFVIGSISLDKFNQHKTISKAEIKKYFNIKSGFDNFAICIFHPADTDMNKSFVYFENILKGLKEKQINTFVSYPNSDPGNKKIIEIINNYQLDSNFKFYKNLDRDMFLSIYKNSYLQIGNSSSGIIESASVPLPVVNVGIRQKGRLVNENVLFCEIDIKSIKQAIDIAISTKFRKKTSKIGNLYGDGNSSIKALELIKNIDFSELVFKKEDILEM